MRALGRTPIPTLLLFAAAVAVYANSLDGGFHFDDWHALEQNPYIRSLANVPRFFADPDTTTVLHENKDLRPVLLTTFALNHALSGAATWSWHLTNVLLHGLVVLLVFRIARDHLWLGEHRVALAAAAALLVAVHPLNTEPVNYLSARSALLAALFYLAAFDSAVRGRAVTCAVLFALALLTKATTMTLPLVVAGYWLLAPRAEDAPRPRWGLVVVLVAIAAAGLAYRALLLPPWIFETSRQPGMTPWTYLMTEWSAYLYYLRLFVWPNALVVDRVDYPVCRSILEPQAWLSLLALIGIAVAAWRVRHRVPAVTFGVFWYLVTLAPESSVFPLAEPVNEHRPYLAMLGLGTVVAIGLFALARRAVRIAGSPGRSFAVGVTAVAAVLAVVTVERNALWRDDYALWRDAIAKAPQNPRAWLNAGHAALTRNDLPEARRMLLEGRRLAPCYGYILVNLSAIETRIGANAESLRWADEAVACQPRFAIGRYYRALALERLGRSDEALAEFRATTGVDSQFTDAWLAQGRLLEARNAWGDAAVAYDRAFASNPTHYEAAMLAGLVYHYRLGDLATATARYRTVLDVLPTHYGAHYQLAVALAAGGDLDEARGVWREFVRLATAIGDRASVDNAPAALRAPQAG